MKPKKQQYALRYRWETEYREGGYTMDDQIDDDHGLCDALFFVSIVLPSDGSYSQMVITVNGQTKEPMSDKEVFKVWMTLGLSLADRGNLIGWHAEIVTMMAKIIRKVFRRNKNVN